MKKLLSLLQILALVASPAFASTGTIVKANVYEGGKNVIQNSSFDFPTSAYGWTITTVTGSKETSTIEDGKQSEKLTYSSQTGGIAQSIVPVVNTDGVNYEASCKVNTTMATIEVCGLAGGSNANCQAVPASGTWQTVTSNFIGPSNGTSVGVKVDTTASGSGTVYVDDCYVGPARNLSQVSRAQWLGDLVVTGCSGNWTATGNASYGDLGTQTGCTYTPSTASQLSAPATNLPAFKLSGGPGKYVVKYNGTIGNAAAAANSQVFYRLTDGTNNSSEEPQWESSSTTAQPITGSGEWTLYETVGFTARTFDIQSRQVTSGQAFMGGQTAQPGVFSVYFYPSQQDPGFVANSTPASWSGYQTVSGGWSTTSATFADVSAGTTPAVTQITTRNITCSQSSTGTAISCNLARTGMHTVCAYPFARDTSISNPSFKLLDSTSGVTLNPGITTTVSTGNAGVQPTVCGKENITSISSPAVFKIQAATDVGTIQIQNGQATGSSAIMWTVDEGDAPQGAPLFTGNITSSSKTQSFRIESMFFAGGTQTSSCTGTCTTYMKTSDWFTGASTGGSVTRTATGQYTLDYTGTFSGIPVCWTSVDVLNGASSVCAVDMSTITSSLVKIRCSQNNFSTNADSIAGITCMGPR